MGSHLRSSSFLHDLGTLGGLYRVAAFVGLAISLALVAVLLQKFAIRRSSKERIHDALAPSVTCVDRPGFAIVRVTRHRYAATVSSRRRIRLLVSFVRKLRVFRWAIGLAVRLLAPRNLVGVAGVLWNERGQVLLVEHMVRFRYAWGLPGGWIERGEDPCAALRREVREEVGLTIDDPVLLLCELTGGDSGILSPRSIAVAFSCSATGDPVLSRELLDYRWIDPQDVPPEILRFHRKAIETAIRPRAATRRE